MTGWPARADSGLLPGRGELVPGWADRRAALFTAGPRLGWTFRDRRLLAAPFPEPPPDPEAIRAAAAQRAQTAQVSYRKFRRYLGIPSAVVLVVLLLAGGCGSRVAGSGPPLVPDLFVLLICAPGIVFTWARWQRAQHAAAALTQAPADHQRAVAAWQHRAAAWQHAELGRLDAAAEWGSATLPDGTLRLDVFGGALDGWQALLTTHATSLLATQPLLVVDLTGEQASQELTEIAAAAGVPTARWLLPADLGACGLLAGLTAAQFADALTEAIHAGPVSGQDRAERATDTRVLEQLHAALGDDVTPARLAAAVRTALGHHDPGGPLTAAEQARISGEVFPAGYRHQIEPNLVRIEAFLATLARQAGDPPSPATPPPPPAYLTCLALESAARTARTEVLAALVTGWLTVQVTGSPEPAPAVIIAGADDLAPAHLERLALACERRRVPLTLMFRHLRDTGLGLLGGGATAFMRLGHHTEAQEAADYIGRQHTFVLSQLTASLGGSQTHTTTHSDGGTVADTINVGWNTGWNTSSTSGAQGAGASAGDSRGQQRSQGRSVSRTWSTARSWADGSTWGDATTTQRVYEYAVEPAVLQNLPDQALLLVTRGSGGPVLQAVECDPAIITLPRVSLSPLPSPAWAQPAAPGTASLPPAAAWQAGPAGPSDTGWPAWARPDERAAQPELPPLPPGRGPGAGRDPGPIGR
jgi:hypothetical protein